MPMQQQLTIRAILTVALTTAAHAQSRIDRLQPLVAVSAKRLAIAERVALAKWDRGTAVEDANREAQVVRAAVASAKEKGLSQQFISTFFSAQIEANKLVQYSLLGEWRRRGRAPEHKPIDLGYVRQELDQLQEQLIQALADTRAARETRHAKLMLQRRSEGMLHVDRGIHPPAQSRSIELLRPFVLLNRTFRKFGGNGRGSGNFVSTILPTLTCQC